MGIGEIGWGKFEYDGVNNTFFQGLVRIETFFPGFVFLSSAYPL